MPPRSLKRWHPIAAGVGAALLMYACGSSPARNDADTGGAGSDRCSRLGGSGSGVLMDAAGGNHAFGPDTTVSYFAGGSNVAGAITLDDGMTKITIFGVTCIQPSCPPPIGDYTDANYTNQFRATWSSASVLPDSLDVHVDAAPPTDRCWGGTFDVVYGFDKGDITGEIKGSWANP